MWSDFLHSGLWLQLTVSAYVLTALVYIISVFFRHEFFNKICLAIFSIGFILNTVFIIDRWIEAGRAPIKSRFEALILLAWCIALLSLIVEFFHRVRIVSLLSSLACVGSLALAFVWYDTLIENLPAALQSFWFIPHVVVYFLGYAAAAVSFWTAVLTLFFPHPRRLKANNLLGQELLDFDGYTYHLIIFAFVMLTLGLVMGALWAKEAWGTYWAWDPKENWALISFLVYGLYLHFRKVKGWRGKPATWFAILGFVAIIITFLGVNYLPTASQSEHTYLD